jgi:hypothetical protein
VPTEAHVTEPGGSGEVREQATEMTQHAASVAVASAAHESVDDSLDGGGGLREVVINGFRQSVSDRVSQPNGVAARSMTVAPGPADRRSRHGETVTRIIEHINESPSELSRATARHGPRSIARSMARDGKPGARS